jgi:FtsP/CotA-like multicopper oxidase with cupredoxin domain
MLGDLFLRPRELTAAPGEVTFSVMNHGVVEHNLAIEGVEATPMIAPGASATLTVDPEPGTYEVLCQVPGHARSGMSGTLEVAAGTATAARDHGTAEGAATMTAAEMRDIDAAVTAKFPAKTKGLGGRLLEPTIEADGTKCFDLTAAPVEWETEPGIIKQAFAYNGQVPGPTIEADLGDRVKMVLHNDLPEPTTLHFHGLTVPNDMDGVPAITQDAVMPGDSFTYEFTVRNTGSKRS